MDREQLRSTLRSTRRLATTRQSSLTVPVSSYDTTNIPLRSRHRTQKFTLVWLVSTIDESDGNYRHSLIQIKELGNTYKIFTDTDECVRFLAQVVDENIWVIVSGFVGEYMMPLVHDMTQVDSIYILCGNVRRHEPWTRKWPKIKGIFTEINSICEILKQILPSEQNSITIRSIPTSDEHYLPLGFLALDDDVLRENLDELDPSFMFTKVLREILLELEYDGRSMREFVAFFRERFCENKEELTIIDDFEREYRPERAIWWYTRESFTYLMLNQALRTLNPDIMIKMGFFLRDLHQQIAQLHIEQSADRSSSHSFIVYRGQGLTSTDFNRLKKSNGGLISFNNFLSTSRDRNISLQFTLGATTRTDHVGILFVMHIDASSSSTPFAHVTDVSYYKAEEETLFSMHSIFRINSIQQMDTDHKCWWQVNLTLTNDNDRQLHALTDRLREETRGSSGWDRIGKLLIKLGMFHNAQQTYNVLLTQTWDDIEKAHIYHQLGYIEEDLGKYDDALSFYEKSLEIRRVHYPSDDSHFAMYYNNVGSIYDKKGDYSRAIAFYMKAIEIYQQILPPNDLRLATCYNNIGSVYNNMCDYSKALSCYKKALEIDEQCRPSTDPSLGIDHNNIGLVYHDMQEYSKALSCFEKAHEIYRRALQSDHPDVSILYNSFGSLYNSMGAYEKALSYYGKALEIDQKTLPPNHPYLGVSYNNMGSAYKNMEEYSQALSMFEHALTIEESTQSPNESRLQLYTKNIEFVRDKLQ